jgi:hypothetical protein
MPNWCNNNATISHQDPEKIEALAQAIREDKFFNHVIPVPKELTETVSGSLGDEYAQELNQFKMELNRKYFGASDWYDFCTSRWGTKWEASLYDGSAVTVENNTIQLGFDTAWAPPIGIYEELMNQGFQVQAQYYEPGMGFVGEWNDGDDLYHESGGLKSHEVRDEIGEFLDDNFGISESMAEWEEENEEPDELEEFLDEGAKTKGLNPPDPIKF